MTSHKLISIYDTHIYFLNSYIMMTVHTEPAVIVVLGGSKH